MIFQIFDAMESSTTATNLKSSENTMARAMSQMDADGGRNMRAQSLVQAFHAALD